MWNSPPLHHGETAELPSRICFLPCVASSIWLLPLQTNLDLQKCDVVFFATPHGIAMSHARDLLAADVRIIDLAADFRLKDTAEFEKWYGMPHACPDILKEAVYGLVEVNREAIRKARVIGLPGCYPTSVQLGFAPLLSQGKPAGQ